MKKTSQRRIYKRAKLIHGDRYDYSLVNYIDIFTDVDIICYEAKRRKYEI